MPTITTRRGTTRRALHTIHPSPENAKLYAPVRQDDSEIQALAESIRRFGLKEPLVISADGWILSGHRRHVAAGLAGLYSVPVRVDPIRKADDPDGFLRLLREHNRQRVKTRDMVLREEILSLDAAGAYERLCQSRRKIGNTFPISPGGRMELRARCKRNGISEGKQPMLRAAIRAIEDLREFWPVSLRQIHYRLLNDPPLRHAKKPASRYCNDLASYNDLSDLLARARLFGDVDMESIDDETRPRLVWEVYQSPGPFIRREMEQLFAGYYRDLLQSQPDHIEVVVEKLAAKSILQPVAAQFCVPMTVGKGYCSIPPRYQMMRRYRASGKRRLVVLMLADYDPDGDNLSESFARSMRDDFGVFDVDAIRVALRADQVQEMRLPPKAKAKKGSATYKRFVKKNKSDTVFELEAVAPDVLQRLLQQSIEAALDREAFDAEVEAERQDAAFLERAREKARLALGGMDDRD